MSSNSLSMTNIKDASFNSISSVTTQDVKNVYDIFALKTEITSPGDLTNLQNQINSKALIESPNNI